MDISFGSSDWDIRRDSPSSTSQATNILDNMETGGLSTDELLADFCMEAMATNKDEVTSDDRLNISGTLSSSMDSLDRMDTQSDSLGPEEMSYMSSESESESDTLIDNRKESTSDDLGISFCFFDDDYDCGDDKDHGPGSGDVSTPNDVGHDNFILRRVRDNHHTTSGDSNISFGFFEDCDFSDTNEDLNIFTSSLDSIDTARSVSDIKYSTSEESESESDTLEDNRMVDNRTETTSRDFGLSFGFFDDYDCSDCLDHGPDSGDDSISNGDYQSDKSILSAVNDNHRRINPFVSSKHKSQSEPIALSSSVHIQKIPHGAAKKEHHHSTINTPTTTTSINRVHPTPPNNRLSLRDLRSLPTQEKKETSSIHIRKIPHGLVKKDNYPTSTNTPTTTSINRDHPTAPIKPMSSKLLHSLCTLGKNGTRVTAKFCKSTNKEQNSEQENPLFWFDFYPDYLEKESFQQFYHDRHLYPCSHGFDPQLCYCQSPWRYKPTTTVKFSTQYPNPPSNSSSESLLSHPTQENKGTKFDARVQYREGFIKVTAL